MAAAAAEAAAAAAAAEAAAEAAAAASCELAPGINVAVEEGEDTVDDRDWRGE